MEGFSWVGGVGPRRGSLLPFGVEAAVVAEQEAGHFGVVEVGGEGVARVEGGDGAALLVGELKVVEGEVGGHAFGPRRLGG